MLLSKTFRNPCSFLVTYIFHELFEAPLYVSVGIQVIISELKEERTETQLK